jgi:hypothetical protein
MCVCMRFTLVYEVYFCFEVSFMCVCVGMRILMLFT